MANKTPDQVAEKFRRGIQGAGEDYRAGVMAPSRPWDQATVAGEARWKAEITRAMNDGRFASGVRAAGNQKWQERAATRGAQNYTASAEVAAQAYAQKAPQIMAAGSAMKQAVASMPSTTLEERIARASSALRAASQYWKGQRR